DEDEGKGQGELGDQPPEKAQEVATEGRLPFGERRGAREDQHAERTDREDVVGAEPARQETALERRVVNRLGRGEQLQREPEGRPEVGGEPEEVDPARE